MKNLLLIGILSALLVGCAKSGSALVQAGNAAISSPELVANNTPKGKLWRAHIEDGRGHWVYWFDGSTNTLTENWVSGSGKHSRQNCTCIESQ